MRHNTQGSHIGYRLRQLRSALRARIDPAEHAIVAERLNPAEQALFCAMPRYDQRHCLDVFHTLVEDGEQDALVLRAALYHDCGKVDDDGCPMALPWYILATLLKRIPPLYIALARRSAGIFRPLYLYAHHAHRGAGLAAGAGAPAEVVATIRHYHDPTPQGRAARLQWADQQH
jgi:GNAT superfamily N-acetyltransferase